MTKLTNWTRVAGAVIVTIAVAAPQVEAQARTRSGSSRGGASSGSGGSGGGGTAAPRSGPSAAPAPNKSTPAPSSTRGTSAVVVSRDASAAGPRVASPRTGFTRVQPLTRFGYRVYSPYYFGTYGLYNSSRFRYGSTLWGYPYYPSYYGYYPMYTYPYGYGSYGYGSSRYRRDEADDDDDRPTGNLRLRANPRHAKVYVDGALVGTVDDFDGLTDHLTLDAGPHQIELRAEGYQTFSMDVSVVASRTKTERISLKKMP